MSLNRRDFLTSTLAGAGGLMLTGALSAATDVAASTDPFQLVPLGHTGLKVSLVGMGTGMRGWNRQSNLTRLGKDKCEALLRYAFDKGIRLFDCADIYGTHPYVAEAFKTLPREKYVLTSKVWVRAGALPEKERPDADVVIDRFRKELATDYLDLVLIHCMEDAQWCDNQKRQMDILENLKAKGVIKAHGVSCHTLGALRAAAASPWVDSVHTRINPYGDSMDDKDPAVVAAVIKDIHAAGKGVVGMKIVGEGRYRNDPDKRDHSIQYVLGLGTVDTMIVGFEKAEEIDDFTMRVQAALKSRSA